MRLLHWPNKLKEKDEAEERRVDKIVHENHVERRKLETRLAMIQHEIAVIKRGR